MVLQERIELSTSPLPRECSTTELLQHPSAFIDRGGDVDDIAKACKRKFARSLDTFHSGG